MFFGFFGNAVTTKFNGILFGKDNTPVPSDLRCFFGVSEPRISLISFEKSTMQLCGNSGQPTEADRFVVRMK